MCDLIKSEVEKRLFTPVSEIQRVMKKNVIRATVNTFNALYYQYSISSFASRDLLVEWLDNSAIIDNALFGVRSSTFKALNCADTLDDIDTLKPLLQRWLDLVLCQDLQKQIIVALDRRALTAHFFMDTYGLVHDVKEPLVLPLSELATLAECINYDIGIKSIHFDAVNLTVTFKEV
jgi:hypothetical protein